MGDFDYGTLGDEYIQRRRADPRIAAYVKNALGSAQTVLNVGAGTGSYEPEDRYVIAVEPSSSMRSRRPGYLPRAIAGWAEQLPLDDQSVDAAMAIATIHQWSDLSKGLNELRRVTRGPIVVVTFDGEALLRFWLADYVPGLIAHESLRCPRIELISGALGAETKVSTIPIPLDCADGFMEAYYARPEAFLNASVRRAQSAWAFAEQGVEERFAEDLARDLSSGEWDRRYGHLRMQACFQGSLTLIVRA